MLSLQSFRKSYANHLVLEIPELTFSKGTHWIKGKNGSGKSTLFNCIAGLTPFEGQILLNNIALNEKPGEYKLLVNYSASEPVFPEFLTGVDLINYFSKLKKASHEEVKALASLLEVDVYAGQPCGSYSSGMMKKLSILLAFLGDPEWIILDEPLITLDHRAQNIVTRLILDKQKEGVSFLFATHQDFENAVIQPTDIYEVYSKTLNKVV